MLEDALVVVRYGRLREQDHVWNATELISTGVSTCYSVARAIRERRAYNRLRAGASDYALTPFLGHTPEDRKFWEKWWLIEKLATTNSNKAEAEVAARKSQEMLERRGFTRKDIPIIYLGSEITRHPRKTAAKPEPASS